MKRWFNNELTDSSSASNRLDPVALDAVDWPRVVPFIGLHLACFAVFYTGVSTTAVIACIISYFIRMFAITGFYHRYFSHKSFKTSRTIQFIFGFLGTTATQRGPLWWAAHHREHHIHSDQDGDAHSPRNGFIKSHVLWFLNKKNFGTKTERIKDFYKYRELRWLDQYDIIPPIIYATAIFLLGWLLEVYSPELGVTKWQLLIWGYFISTILLGHITFCINSLAHKVGKQRFITNDDSKNNWLLAILTLGEGWHNNHHKFPSSAKQGIYWWELDISYYILWFMQKVGLVWDLKSHDKVKLNSALEEFQKVKQL